MTIFSKYLIKPGRVGSRAFRISNVSNIRGQPRGPPEPQQTYRLASSHNRSKRITLEKLIWQELGSIAKLRILVAEQNLEGADGCR